MKAKENGWNVYRIVGDGETMLLAACDAEDAAIDAAHRLGGDQVQRGLAGEVRNIERGNWFASAKAEVS